MGDMGGGEIGAKWEKMGGEMGEGRWGEGR